MNMFYENHFLSTLGIVGIATVTGIVGYKAGKAAGYVKGIAWAIKTMDEAHDEYWQHKNERVNYQPYYTK